MSSSPSCQRRTCREQLGRLCTWLGCIAAKGREWGQERGPGPTVGPKVKLGCLRLWDGCSFANGSRPQDLGLLPGRKAGVPRSLMFAFWGDGSRSLRKATEKDNQGCENDLRILAGFASQRDL